MLIDASLFFNEFEFVDMRLKYLNEKVDIFCFIESERTFTGEYKGFKLNDYIKSSWPELSDRVVVIENREYLTEKNLKCSLDGYPGFKARLKSVVDNVSGLENSSTWINDFFQRELLLKLTDMFSDEAIVIVCDIDEFYKNDLDFELYSKDVIYLALRYFKFSTYFEQDISWIKVYFTSLAHLRQNGVNYLRSAFQRNAIDNIISNAGWHFTSFGNSQKFKEKLKQWGHQEYNTYIGRVLAGLRFKYGLDPFGAGEIIKYKEADIDKKIDLLLRENFSFDFKEPTTLILFVHKAAVLFEKIYRKIHFRNRENN